ncbi:MAG: DUF5615 family PIN-like protein [Saprospiraceae bacterium]|nr:DUF5615 family PIN-like protein [Saprospiraceae bacterium]
MKFLIDAQLPKALAIFLNNQGYQSIYTLDLPSKNKTSDSEIIELSIRENLIQVISKDSDFYNSFLQKGEPYKLIYLKVGNMSTTEISSLFANNLSVIVNQITANFVIEISKKNIITII